MEGIDNATGGLLVKCSPSLLCSLLFYDPERKGDSTKTMKPQSSASSGHSQATLTLVRHISIVSLKVSTPPLLIIPLTPLSKLDCP
jgi:hypothetical protein